MSAARPAGVVKATLTVKNQKQGAPICSVAWMTF
jgi:hypothetical protein